MSNAYEKMERYLKGELEDAEKIAFENQLQSDATLAAEVQLYQELMGTVSRKEDQEAFKASLKEISPKYFAHRSRRLFFVLATSAAAAIALLFLWSPWQGSLYDKYVKHPQAAFSSKGAAEETAKQAGARAFNQGDFGQALSHFQQLAKEAPDQAEWQLYESICLLELGQYEAARERFATLSEGSSIYQSTGRWYLVLTALKQGQFEECKDYIQRIPVGDSYYAKAQELLRELP